MWSFAIITAFRRTVAVSFGRRRRRSVRIGRWLLETGNVYVQRTIGVVIALPVSVASDALRRAEVTLLRELRLLKLVSGHPLTTSTTTTATTTMTSWVELTIVRAGRGTRRSHSLALRLAQD